MLESRANIIRANSKLLLDKVMISQRAIQVPPGWVALAELLYLYFCPYIHYRVVRINELLTEHQ